jgi:ribonuclease BN (tRNA processing enzyme)
LIVVNGTPYLVDFGPGVVRRAVAAYQQGVTAVGLRAINLRVAFVTHLHSDHTAGLSDLILTPWVMGREEPLEVYGPKGIRSMSRHILEAYKLDIQHRIHSENISGTGCQVHAHEIQPGVIYTDANVTVKAFRVHHDDLEAYGFRFETPDRTIVLSGDTAPCQSLIENATGCDVLIHEGYTEASYAAVAPEWQRYRRSYHTSTRELAEIASKTKPRLLIIIHRENPGGVGARPEAEYLEEIRHGYDGPVVIGHDLEVY